MIRGKNFQGVAKTITSNLWIVPVINTANAYHMAAGTLQNIAVGGTPTGFLSQYTKNPQSLFFTAVFGGGTLTSFVLQLTGENIFGDVQTEQLTFTAVTGLTLQTALCYRRVTALTVVSYTGTQTPAATDTIQFGYSLVNPKIPLLCRLDAPQSILTVNDMNQQTKASQPTFAVTLANPAVTVGGNTNLPTLATGVQAYLITLTGTIVASATGSGEIMIYLNPDDSQL
jgi:hypothetical protein